MAGVKGNRRTIYTKKVIKESLVNLLDTKEIHEVTVTDICKLADINRGTFYTHYRDQFQLLQYMEDELFDKILKYVNETKVEDYKDVLMVKVFDLIAENKRLSKILFCKQKDSRILERILYIASKAGIEQIVNCSSGFNEVYLNYLIRYSVGGIFAMIQTWLENDLKEDPNEILNILNSITKANQEYFN